MKLRRRDHPLAALIADLDRQHARMPVTDELARTLGNQIGFPWECFDFEAFRRGLAVELRRSHWPPAFGRGDTALNQPVDRRHWYDPITAAQRVHANLTRSPRYYSHWPCRLAATLAKTWYTLRWRLDLRRRRRLRS